MKMRGADGTHCSVLLPDASSARRTDDRCWYCYVIVIRKSFSRLIGTLSVQCPHHLMWTRIEET